MKMSKTKWFERLGVIVFFFMAGGLLLLVSCTSWPPVSSQGEPGMTQQQSLKGLVFQSDEYIIYKLHGGETPVTLAERFLGNKTKAWMIEEENRETPFKRGRVVVIPLKEKNRGGLAPKGYQVVPILTYHTFSESCKTPLCTPRKRFDRQMKYLKDNQYRVISLKQLRGFLRYRHRLPEKSIVITFDDGYSTVYDIAYPVFKKYGFKGTLLIYTDFVEKSKNAITWGELKELKAAGFEIGSHGVSHDDLTKKKKGENDKAYLARVERELLLSKKIIDKKLRQNTIYLAFPFGNYNQKILHLSEQLGYKVGLSVKRGGNPFFADPLALRRYQIRNMDMKSFVTRLGTFKKYSLE